MSIDHIERFYGVPAKIGGRVNYTGSGKPRPGTIVSVEGARLRIKLDDRPDYVGLYHPTWELEYLDDDAPAVMHAADCISFFTACPGPCDCNASREVRANG